MSEQQTLQKDPPQLPGIPQVPIPQTNEGTLEHTGLPVQRFELITDIPPDYSWMVSQWKYVDKFEISATEPNISSVGDMVYQTLVIGNTGQYKDKSFLNNWLALPFRASYWWNGVVSYRFTAIKPPRVTGKLLIRFRQDAFQKLGTGIDPIYPSATSENNISDKLYRSILKEWDLSQSSQFEFDISSALPIRARPTHYANRYTPSGGQSWTAVAQTFDPWTEMEMGRIVVEIAQHVSPGGIFPDTYTILVEKSIKMPQFYATTDLRATTPLTLERNNQ